MDINECAVTWCSSILDDHLYIQFVYTEWLLAILIFSLLPTLPPPHTHFYFCYSSLLCTQPQSTELSLHQTLTSARNLFPHHGHFICSLVSLFLLIWFINYTFNLENSLKNYWYRVEAREDGLERNQRLFLVELKEQRKTALKTKVNGHRNKCSNIRDCLDLCWETVSGADIAAGVDSYHWDFFWPCHLLIKGHSNSTLFLAPRFLCRA